MNSINSQNVGLVVDDHPLVARGVAAFLKSHCKLEVAHAVNHATEAWEYVCSNNPPALIMLDFWLPDGASLPLIEKLKVRCPTSAILVMSADDDIDVQNKVQKYGVHGFINKQESTESFIEAVNVVLDGRTWFIDRDKKKISNHVYGELTISTQELGLTARQGEILSLIIQGLPNKRIAQLLLLSEQTVKEHVSGILSRLGVNNRVEAITRLRGKRLE